MADEGRSVLDELIDLHRNLADGIGEDQRSAGEYWDAESLQIGGDRRNPGGFNPQSYLLIRSFEGDDGTRPVPEEYRGKSPAISVFRHGESKPARTLAEFTSQESYQGFDVSVEIRNVGGIDSPSAKVVVEIIPEWKYDDFLHNTSELSKHTYAESISSAWVGADQKVIQSINFGNLDVGTTTSYVGGSLTAQSSLNRILIYARVYSLSPFDCKLSSDGNIDVDSWTPHDSRHEALLILE